MDCSTVLRLLVIFLVTFASQIVAISTPPQKPLSNPTLSSISQLIDLETQYYERLKAHNVTMSTSLLVAQNALTNLSTTIEDAGFEELGDRLADLSYVDLVRMFGSMFEKLAKSACRVVGVVKEQLEIILEHVEKMLMEMEDLEDFMAGFQKKVAVMRKEIERNIGQGASDTKAQGEGERKGKGIDGVKFDYTRDREFLLSKLKTSLLTLTPAKVSPHSAPQSGTIIRYHQDLAVRVPSNPEDNMIYVCSTLSNIYFKSRHSKPTISNIKMDCSVAIFIEEEMKVDLHKDMSFEIEWTVPGRKI